MKGKDKFNDKDKIIKKALHYKRLSSLLADNKFSNFINGLINLKKYNVQKRGQIFTNVYVNFFKSGDIIKEAKMNAYQNYYEDFMINNIKDEVKYSEILSYCVNNAYYLHIVTAVRGLKELQEQGLDFDKLSERSKEFYKRTMRLKSECNFNDEFNYEKFYTDRNLNKDISQKIRYYILDIEKVYDMKQEEIM